MSTLKKLDSEVSTIGLILFFSFRDAKMADFRHILAGRGGCSPLESQGRGSLSRRVVLTGP